MKNYIIIPTEAGEYELCFDTWQNLWSCAIFGGIDYWGSIQLDDLEDIGVDEAYAKYTWACLIEPKIFDISLEVIDREEGDVHRFRPSDLKRAVAKLLSWGGAIERDFRNDEIDANVADVWIQVAVFGELVYG